MVTAYKMSPNNQLIGYFCYSSSSCTNVLFSILESLAHTTAHYMSSSADIRELTSACRRGDILYVRRILQSHRKGSDWLGAQDDIGETAIHAAVEGGHLEIVHLLIKAGCKVDVASLNDKCTLLNAAFHGNTELVECLLKVGCKKDVGDKVGETTLHAAVERGHLEIVHLLIKAGCNVDVVNKAGETALHKAVEGGHLEIVHLLIKAGCNVDVVNKAGETALHKAVEGGHLEIVHLLIKAGCNVDVVNKAGETALHAAVERGHLEIVHLLIKAGCKVDVAFLNDKGTLLLASLNANTELVNCLLEQGCQVDAVNYRGETALHKAAEKGHLEIVHLLIKAGCNVDVVNKAGETALHKAVEGGHLEIVHLLIKAGCKVDVASLNDKCTLLNAAFHGNTELVECLLKVGCNKDVGDKIGETILHAAVERGHLEIVHLLIKAGCNVDVVNKAGETALHKAVERGHLEIVHLLIKAGCNVDVVNKAGETALHAAVERGHLEIVHLLIKAGCNVDVVNKAGETALHKAVERGHLEIVHLLIKAGCNVDVVNKAGETALHKAVEGGHLEIVHLLIKAGCKVDVFNKVGETALHKAAEKGLLEIIHLLMKAGCQVDEVSRYFQTALMIAAMTSQADAIKYLLEAGSKVNLRDHRDRTALHYSAEATDPEIPLTLLEAGADFDAQDEDGETFADLANNELLQSVKSNLLSLESRRMFCVIGHSKVGKSTLVEAIRESNKDYWFKEIRNVRNIPNRTAGIDVKTLDDEKYGRMLFFNFAGQSEYYSSHYAFLEAALSSRGTIITFLMVVDLRIPYKERVDQCMEWLSPIKSISTSNVQIHVTLIGSHLDDVSFLKKSEITGSHSNCFQELKSNFVHSNIEFIDCLSMDCRKLSSQGLQQLKSYFKSDNRQSLARQAAESIVSQVPLHACLFWKKVQHQRFLQLSNILQTLSSPYTICLIHECCQDLSSAGLAIYLPNKETLEDGWLILEIEEVITDIHGKLFAPESNEFPMHHKDLANKSGLVLSSELDHVFEFTSLSPKLIKELLISMEFCHPVDSNLLRDEIRSLLATQDEWLYFPSLVSQDTPSNPLAPSPSDVQNCVWLCWELRGLEYPFLSLRFQHSIFLRLAHKVIQMVTDDQKSQILQHSCTVWKNGIFWSTVHEVDFQVQTFSSKATVQVLVRSRNGILPLMKEAPKVIQEVIKMKEHHCPNMKTVSILVKVKGGIPSGVQAAVSSVIKTVEKGGTAVVPYGSEEITTIPLSEFFYDWSLSQDCVPVLKQMNQKSVTEHSPEGTYTMNVCLRKMSVLYIILFDNYPVQYCRRGHVIPSVCQCTVNVFEKYQY